MLIHREYSNTYPVEFVIYWRIGYRKATKIIRFISNICMLTYPNILENLYPYTYIVVVNDVINILFIKHWMISLNRLETNNQQSFLY